MKMVDCLFHHKKMRKRMCLPLAFNIKYYHAQDSELESKGHV